MAEPVRDDIEEIVRRRFGPAFEKPCHHSSVVVCAYWECQVANQCVGLRHPERPAPPELVLAPPPGDGYGG